jgi:hypothetical protein
MAEEKLYKKSTQYGKLKTITGDTFRLMSPYPVPSDSWMRDYQQSWLVTNDRYEEAVVNKDDSELLIAAYNQPFQIVTSYPTIIYDKLTEILVWTGEYADPEKEEVTVEDEASEEDVQWMQNQANLILT